MAIDGLSLSVMASGSGIALAASQALTGTPALLGTAFGLALALSAAGSLATRREDDEEDAPQAGPR